MKQSDVEDLLSKIARTESELESGRKRLQEMSEKCLMLGEKLGADPKVLEQTKLVDKLMVTREKLLEMRDQIKEKETDADIIE